MLRVLGGTRVPPGVVFPGGHLAPVFMEVL
jgi:hypothetical protein